MNVNSKRFLNVN